MALKLAYFTHTIRSDWNNGNAHFLRGLMREMVALGHEVTVYEQDHGWSADNLLNEAVGQGSLDQFAAVYPDITVRLYDLENDETEAEFRRALEGLDAVIVHEWNDRRLIDLLLGMRKACGFRAVFHDTHHRASSSPESIRDLRVNAFDGVLSFGDALTRIYKESFDIERCWTLHEAADTTVFYPRPEPYQQQLVWVGNWGDGERSAELMEFLVRPAERLRSRLGADRFCSVIFGVRYPEDGLKALEKAGIRYGGYLPNLAAPEVYARSQMTMHVPRQQYSTAMKGIPTIRVFEALACGIPLLSAPWEDTEELFRPGDFRWVRNGDEAEAAMRWVLEDAAGVQAQVESGLATVLARHTCAHRATQLTRILEEEVLA